MEKNNIEGASHFNNGYTILILLMAVVVFAAIIYKSDFVKKTDDKKIEIVTDYRNATYTIDGVVTKLTNGRSVIVTDPVLETSVTTQYVGNEAIGDFDKDGRMDIAFVVRQDTGGSGTFYYLVAALNKESGYVGGEATFLGDRILLESTAVVDEDIIVVKFKDRKPTDDFTVAPSVSKSIALVVATDPLSFGPIENESNVEAEPLKMTLTMKPWNWVGIEYADGRNITPRIQNKFILTFKNDGRFSMQTDCNGIGGEYVVNDNTIKLERMMSTLMSCEGSQESDFSQALNKVDTYKFTSKGALILELKDGKGIMIFN